MYRKHIPLVFFIERMWLLGNQSTMAVQTFSLQCLGLLGMVPAKQTWVQRLRIFEMETVIEDLIKESYCLYIQTQVLVSAE